MNTSVQTFGEYLTAWMTNRGYSAAALASLVGAKSATTVARLKADQATPARCAEFLERLTAAMPDIPQEELRAFRTGIKMLELGREHYYAYRAIHNMVIPEALPEPQHSTLLRELLSFADTQTCDILCMQCLDNTVLHAMIALCRHSRGQLQIRHYITFPLRIPSAHLIDSALPILCDSRYQVTLIDTRQHRPQLNISTQNFFFIRYTRDGEERSTIIIPSDDGNALRIENVGCPADFDRLLHTIHKLDYPFVNLKSSCDTTTPEGICAYLKNICAIEKKRSQYIIKRDLPLHFIPLQILQNAFNDALGRDQPAHRSFAVEYRRLCYERICALQENDKPIKLLCSHTALQRFVQTGQLHAHYFGLRSFTQDECIAIIEALLHMLETKPNISLYFAKNNDIFHEHNFYCYDQHGVLIAPARTNYYLATTETSGTHSYAEVLIPDITFTEHMARFFDDHMLPYHAYSADESLQMLREMHHAALRHRP